MNSRQQSCIVVFAGLKTTIARRRERHLIRRGCTIGDYRFAGVVKYGLNCSGKRYLPFCLDGDLLDVVS